MQKRLILSIYICLILLIILNSNFICSALADSEKKPYYTLICEIKSDKSTYLSGEDIFIDLRIINKSPDGIYIWNENPVIEEFAYAIYNNFSPEGFPPSKRIPKSELRFIITDQNGTKINYKGKHPQNIHVTYASPQCSDFQDLLPDSFIGHVFNITSGFWSYCIEEPGDYTIQAVYVNNTRSWLKEIQKDEPSLYSRYILDLPENRWWDGAMLSNKIRVKVERKSL